MYLHLAHYEAIAALITKRKGVFVTKGIISLLCLIAGFGSDGFCAVTTHRFITGTAFAKLRGPLQDSGSIIPQAKRASSNVACRRYVSYPSGRL